MKFHFDPSAPNRVAHVLSISKEAYVEIKNAMPATSRFTNVEQWGFNHVWMFDPTGDILILTAEPIEKLEHRTLVGAFK